MEACKRKDITALEESLQGLKGVRKEITADYLDALLKAEFSTIADVERILELTNTFVAQAESDRKLGMLLSILNRTITVIHFPKKSIH